jgi:hypothetical protein
MEPWRSDLDRHLTVCTMLHGATVQPFPPLITRSVEKLKSGSDARTVVISSIHPRRREGSA